MAVSDGEQGTPSLEQLRDCLLDRSQPIAKRTHSAFFLRTLGTAEAVSAVGEGMYVRNARVPSSFQMLITDHAQSYTAEVLPYIFMRCLHLVGNVSSVRTYSGMCKLLRVGGGVGLEPVMITDTILGGGLNWK